MMPAEGEDRILAGDCKRCKGLLHGLKVEAVLVNNTKLYQGDIIVRYEGYNVEEVPDADICTTDDLAKEVCGWNTSPTDPISQSIGRSNPDFLWPGRVIPFKISKRNQNLVQAFASAALAVQSVVPIRFVAWNRHAHYLSVLPAPDYGSEVGCMWQGPQAFWVGDSLDHGKIMHELCHAIGLFHEHARPDRDRYVKVNMENIKPAYRSEFFKINHERAMFKYDYDSIMHYPMNAFSIDSNKFTIVPVHNNVMIGQRNRLSEGDIKGIKALYS